MTRPASDDSARRLWLVAAVMFLPGLALWSGIYFAVVQPVFGEPGVVDFTSFFVGAPLCSAALTAAFVTLRPQPTGTRGAMAGASALTSVAVLIGLGTLAMLAVAAIFTWG